MDTISERVTSSSYALPSQDVCGETPLPGCRSLLGCWALEEAPAAERTNGNAQGPIHFPRQPLWAPGQLP